MQVNLHIWPHLTFYLLMWPLTPEYHGGQHRASTIQVWLQTCRVGKLSTVIVLQVNLHIWPHLNFDLLMWPLTPEYHGGQHRASTIQVWLQTCRVGKLSTVVLQVHLHIWPHLTFDLLMWPLTPEYHGGQYRASTNQVWLQTDAGLESYSSFCKHHGRTQFGSLSLLSTSVGSTKIK